MQIGGSPRVPVFNGTAVDMAAYTAMLAGDLWYTTDTLKLFTYSGAAWIDVLAGITASPIDIIEHKNLAAASSTTFNTGTWTSYDYLLLVFNLDTSAGATLSMTLNNDTGNNYTYKLLSDTTISNVANNANAPLYTWGTAHKGCGFEVLIGRVKHGARINFNVLGSNVYSTPESHNLGGTYGAAADITRVDLAVSSGNLTGDMTLYGMKTA